VRELAELHDGLEEVLAGHGRLFLISGEPGIGKTCLAEQLSTYASERAAIVIWGTCWEGSGAPAYWPWIQIFRSFMGDDHSQRLETLLDSEAPQIAELLPEAARLCRPSSTATKLHVLPSGNNLEEARFRLFDSAARLLKNLANADPLVIVLDDLQEADQPSLLMLRFVARELKESRVMLVGNYREGVVRSSLALSRLIGEIAREGHQLALRGLNEAQVARFVQERGGQAAEPGLVGTIMRATAGNPLFLDGVIRMLVAEGKLARSDRLTMQDLRIPDSIREAIRQRLGLFSQRARSVLSIAAVTGQEFEFECLQRVSGDTVDSLLEALDEIQRDGIVDSVGNGRRRYRFAHDLIRETIYQDLPVSVRLRIHQQIAHALEELYAADPSLHLAELSHHYRASALLGDSAKAFDYSVRAGDAALAVFAYEETANQWRSALEIAEREQTDAQRVVDLYSRLGGLMVTLDLAEGVRYLEKALGLYTELGLQIEEARIHAALGQLAASLDARMDVRAAIEHYRKGEALIATQPKTDVTLRLLGTTYSGIAAASARSLRIRDGLIASHRGIKLSRRTNDEWLYAWSGAQQALHLHYAGRLAKAHSLISQVWEVADHTNQVGVSLNATRIGGGTRATIYDYEQTLLWYERELSSPRTANTRYHRGILQVLLGETFLIKGQPARAQAFLPQMSADPLGHAPGFIAFCEGRWEDSERLWTQVYERSRRVGGRDEGYGYSSFMSWVRRTLGLQRKGEMLLSEALSLCRGQALQYVEMWARPELILLYADTGRFAEGLPHIARCKQILAAGEEWHGIRGKIARAEAVLAAAAGSFEKAQREFEQGVSIFRFYQVPFEEAETLYYWARALESAGEHSRAAEKIEAAIEIYSHCGAGERWIERASAVKHDPHFVSSQNASEASDMRAHFCKEGDYWTIGFEGAICRLKHTKGLLYIAYLLRHPGMELSTLDLIHFGQTNGEQPIMEQQFEHQESSIKVRPDLGDAGAALDHQAKVDYHRRLRELRPELDEAERFNDLGRRERLRAEIDFLTAELTAHVGRRSKNRKAASHAERARLAVYKRIRSSLDEIRKANPALGKHLAKTLRTGYRCAYLPERRMDWNF
jgi:tetratricopeptide (TPR) repeat protein